MTLSYNTSYEKWALTRAEFEWDTCVDLKNAWIIHINKKKNRPWSQKACHLSGNVRVSGQEPGIIPWCSYPNPTQPQSLFPPPSPSSPVQPSLQPHVTIIKQPHVTIIKKKSCFRTVQSIWYCINGPVYCWTSEPRVWFDARQKTASKGSPKRCPGLKGTGGYGVIVEGFMAS